MDLIFQQTCLSARGTIFEGKIKQTGAHAFPDIIANKFFGIDNDGSCVPSSGTKI